MRIAIVDDEEKWRVLVERIVKEFAWQEEIVIDMFKSGKDISEAEGYDVVFMDVEMPEMDGFEVAGICREKDKDTIIVFLTTHTELSRRGYLVNAFRYIDKAHIVDELDEALRAIAEICKKNQVLKLHLLREGDFEIPLCEILFIETDKRNVLIHTEQQKVVSNRKIDELEQELKEYGFFRCHKSYLVNLDKIDSIEPQDACFKNGEKAMVSVRKLSELKQRRMEYKIRYANS